MDNQELKSTADTLRKNKQYDEALPLYQQLWESDFDQNRDWIGWGYAICLRKLGKSAQALTICRKVYKTNSEMSQNRSLYAWCVFDTEMKKENSSIKEDEQDFFKAANAILKLSPEISTYSPKAKAVFRVIDYLAESRVNYPAAEILEWLDKLDPDQLSKECSTGPGKNGKQVEYASDEEKWFSQRAKALDRLEKYSECKQTALRAIETVERFHNDNDIWFNYRIAIADLHLGFLDDARARLEKIHQRKKDYFIDYELANVAYAQKRVDEAIRFACAAALAPGQTSMGFRWKVYFLLGKLFKENGELNLAQEHILLVYKIRTEAGWNIPAEVDQLVWELPVDLDDQRSATNIERSLQGIWKKTRYEDRIKIRGHIIDIFKNGKAGHIKGEDGKKYYYNSRELRGDQDLFDYGIEVEFYVEPTGEEEKLDSAVEIHRFET